MSVHPARFASSGAGVLGMDRLGVDRMAGGWQGRLNFDPGGRTTSGPAVPLRTFQPKWCVPNKGGDGAVNRVAGEKRRSGGWDRWKRFWNDSAGGDAHIRIWLPRGFRMGLRLAGAGVRQFSRLLEAGRGHRLENAGPRGERAKTTRLRAG